MTSKEPPFLAGGSTKRYSFCNLAKTLWLWLTLASFLIVTLNTSIDAWNGCETALIVASPTMHMSLSLAI